MIVRYTLQYFNETHGGGRGSEGGWSDLCVDVPRQFSSLESFRATLGHKANHSFRANAGYSLFSAHPVLGAIMSLVALEDLPPNTEVLCNYGYTGHVYDALQISYSDQECFKVTTFTFYWVSRLLVHFVTGKLRPG